MEQGLQEMSDLSFGIAWLFVYLGIASLTLYAVREFGPVSVSSGYVVECRYDEGNGRDNVAYRIVAPPLCCSALLLALQILCERLSLGLPTHAYLATVLYWVLLFLIKWRNRKLKGRSALVLAEAVASVLIAIMFDRFILSAFQDLGVGVFDSSSIAFQMELAAFYVLTGAIAARFIRLESGARGMRCVDGWTDGLPSSSYSAGSFNGYTSATVDTSESKLFMYEREYGSLLSERCSRDILLRALFFSIMAIEDANRPPAMRLGERMLSVFGLAKTTGIMQQGSKTPLSDADSVRLAVPYVERMWDRFLKTYARSSESGYNGESVVFSGTYYKYSYSDLVGVVRTRFSLLYGDYCGTRSLNADYVFQDVLRFEEAQRYGMMPGTVSAEGTLFPGESAWLSGQACYWSSVDCISSCEIAPDDTCAHTVYKEGVVGAGEIGEVTALLKSINVSVFEVKRIGAVAVWIGCNGDAQEIAQLLGPGWSIERRSENGR